MEELCTLSAGRWEIIISQVEPGTVEHSQGARTAVSVFCDGDPFVAYAFTESRKGEGSLAEDGSRVNEQPDFVRFVLSRRDIEKLEFLLARVHQLLRDGDLCPDVVHGAHDLAKSGVSTPDYGDRSKILPRGRRGDGEESDR